MPHAIWSGSLAFGMVSIPVQLHSAVHEHAIHFHQISKASRRRIHYRKVVEGSDEPVDDADIVVAAWRGSVSKEVETLPGKAEPSARYSALQVSQ